MSASITSERGALIVVFVGIALTLAAAGLASLLDEPLWRWLATGGVLVQVIGWVRYSSARRGGAV
ncbi:hypothetical protein [Streptomyces sp. OR43]|uniref:hypothetical protein n=1 Tax=Streptomyces sp. or43 TaxID=2478957 RepID=UPI0011CDC9FB|nr:hypothetical protein [Streptomyces sp. or43]TXS36391.1 hypothetical protein EAO72_23075 [Streptomyces sp. or43]